MRKFIVLIILFYVGIIQSYGQQEKYITYKVKKGETIKTIAKRLGLKTKVLLRLNPGVGRKPSPQTIIVVPNTNFEQNDSVNTTIVEPLDSSDAPTTTTSDQLSEGYVIHKVVKGDTFYNITRFYNISEKELRILNPILENQELQLDMLLKIKPIEEENDFKVYRDTIQQNTSVKLALMLPFRAIEYDTIDAKDIFKNNKLVNITTDLYLGALIALDSLRNIGVNLELSIFDTGRKNTKLDSILSVTDFSETDAVIGPLYSEEVSRVANRTGIPVVFPVYSKKQNTFKSSRIIKTYADRDFHQKELVDYILTSYSNENIVIIGDSTSTSIRNSDLIKSRLLEHDSISEAQIIYPNEGYIRKDYIINALKAEIGNWVILATNNSIIASDAINSLISLPTEEPEEPEEEEENEEEEGDEPEMQILPEDTVIKVFGIFKSNQFDRIDNNKLAKLGFTYTTDIFIDESSPEIQRFNLQFIKKNNAYPSYYATKGFDIVFDTSMRLASGNELKETFKKGVSYRLESKFDYSKNLFQTSTNNGIYIIQYNPDLTQIRIK